MEHRLTYRQLDWPQNLLADLGLDGQNLPPDLIPSLEYLLTERAQRFPRSVGILRQRYQDQEKLEVIGRPMGITRERVRQLINHELRYLQHPEHIKYLQYGVRGVARKQETAARELGWKEGRNYTETHGRLPVPPIDTVTLEDLGLTTRPYNILKRAGKTTVADILAMDFKRLIHLRNMGRKSYEEIIRTLEREGFDCSRLKPQEEVV